MFCIHSKFFSLFFSKFFKKEKFNIVYPKFGYILYLFPILLFSLLININLGIKNFKDYYSTLNNNYDLKFSPNQTDLIEGENVLIFNKIERADYFYMLKRVFIKKIIFIILRMTKRY